MRTPSILPALALSLIVLLIAAATACAQEVQVPIDSSGTLETIDAELELRLHLFPEVENFDEARLYSTGDTAYVLEIASMVNGRRQRERRALTPAAVADLRHRVSALLAERAPEAALDQDGRSLFITGTTVLGLGYYGPAMIIATGADDGRTAVALYMLTAASGFFVPFLATQHSAVTKAQAKLSLYGFAAGALHGHMLYGLAGGTYDGDDGQTGFAVSVAAGLAEGIAGYMLADNLHLSEGKVDVVTSLATFGLGFGAGTSFLLGADSWQAASAGMFAGTVAGGFVGNAMANAQDYSSGDASVMSTAGVVGAYAPIGVMLLAGVENDDGKVWVGAAMAGAAGGIALGHHLVGGHQFSDAQGMYVTLGTAATTGLALGIAYLVGSDRSDEKLYGAAGLVGSVGGFALMYSVLEEKARSKEMGSTLRLDISPAAIGAYALGRAPSGNVTVPMASLSYRY